MTFTFDTNIISYLFNFTLPEHQDFRQVFIESTKKYLKGEDLLVTNPIIKGESIGGFQAWIQYGKQESGNKKMDRKVIMTNTIEFLTRIQELGFNEKVYSIYGILNHKAKQKFKHPQGGHTKKYYQLYNDIWIGALCIAHDSTLVTNNIQDFEWMQEMLPELTLLSKNDFLTRFS